jgi:transcriptional regulator with XRE-family HTH domain
MEAETLAQRLSRRLHEARLATGLTVREAAARANLPSHSQLVRYEQGIAQPPLERLAALARAYNTTPAALLSSNDEAVEVIATIDQADAAMVAELVRVLAAKWEG